MCQCRYILSKKCPALVTDIDHEGPCACVECTKISVPSAHFYYKPKKCTLINKVLKIFMQLYR